MTVPGNTLSPSRLSLFAMKHLFVWLVLIPTMATGQFPNIQVNSPFSTDPEEVTIAINPSDPLNLAAGANLRYAYMSTDGGLSWSQGSLPVGTWGDPCVLFDGSGNLYYGHLANKVSFIDRLIVHRSTDGGRSWKDSVELGYNPPKQQDKEWLATDVTNSPYHGNVYIAWTQFDAYASAKTTDSSRILFSRSTDQGGNWSTPITISDLSGDCLDSDSTDEGAVPAVGPNGEVYVSWGGPLGIEFDRSTDGGVTFGKDVHLSDQPGGWDFRVPGIYRCNGMPVTACDISTSPYRGRIYVGWSDQRNGTDNTDVFCAWSSDGGSTWESPRKVNTDVGVAQQFFTWMTIDQSTGILYFIFYDRRNHGGDTTDVYLARSADGGETFTNVMISSRPFVPHAVTFFGDYTNIVALNGKVYPIWMRLDANILSVWTVQIQDSLLTSVPGSVGVALQTALFPNYPNPFNPRTTIGFRLATGMKVTLEVYDLLGRRIASLVDGFLQPGFHEVPFDGGGLASGVYFCRLRSVARTWERAMVLLK